MSRHATHRNLDNVLPAMDVSDAGCRPGLSSQPQRSEASAPPPALTATAATATPVRTFPQLEPRGLLSGAKRAREGKPRLLLQLQYPAGCDWR